MDNTQTIKVMIIDDEFPARKLLSDYVSKVPNFELCKQCSDAIEASTFLQSNPIDLIFTDIQMPELSGLDFVKSLVNKPMVVFTTAYSDYAIESYDLEAVYYLLKPISFPSFMKAANKAIELFNLKHPSENTDSKSAQEDKDFLMVKADYKLYRINFDDLIYIEGQSEYVTFHLTDKKITAYYSLKKLEEELPATRFIRIHKSYIVALKRIEAIEGNMVVIGKEKLAIGKNYKDILMQVLYKSDSEE